MKKTPEVVGRYRDQSKRDRTPYWGQVQRWVVKARTKEGWMQLFDELTPKEKWEILKNYTPVPREVKADMNSTFVLNFIGLDKPAIQGEEIAGELEEHKEEDE